jgi:enamine deaminase RidA (YjgF/YER057c/UK114 family)
MAKIEERLSALGLVLPEPVKPPQGVILPFRFARVMGKRVFVSGHGPQLPDGVIAGPLGKVGRTLTVDQGYAAARLTALSVFGSLKRALGDLDRVTAWLRVFGMVNAAAGFNRMPSVINGFSDLVLELWGPEAGAHARSAVGMAELPFDIPVEVEAEVEIDGGP